MKLTDLEPRWLDKNVAGKPIGVSFLCPHCRDTRLGVFWEKIAFHDLNRNGVVDEGELVVVSDKSWSRSGDSFENLSLAPSVDASSSGHWHGFITNGEVT